MTARPKLGRASALVTGALLSLPLAAVPTAAASASPGGASAVRGATVAYACPAPTPGHASCLAEVVLSRGAGRPRGTPTPFGFGPADLRSAYQLPAERGRGQTIAVVDAYDDPTAEADLGHYRAAYGLPPCTTRDGCFTKLDQRGGTSYPVPDAGWAQETSLDLDMVSAICPRCGIVLVEADDTLLQNLALAVDTAATRNVAAISNSYGAGQDVNDNALLPDGSAIGAHYNHPHIAVTASTGDFGYGLNYPASSRFTVAVGGTSLTRTSTGRGWSETAWGGAGSGCSTQNAKPPWQATIRCPRRAEADVAAIADPSTGVAVYDSYGVVPAGWYVLGGTSVSTPIIAAVYGLAGNASSVAYPASLPYAHTSHLHDVTSGGNGFCRTAEFCIARPGYDGPTGLGTPNGVGAF